MKKSSFLSAIALVVIAGFLFTACPPEAEDTYSVTYDGNGATGGEIPTDSTAYGANATVTVLGNTGTLVKTGYTFTGWNTLANGTGTDYAAGSGTFNITANTTLYAKWTAEPTYTVTFNTDGGSTPPAPITAVSGTTITLPTAPTKTSYDFAGWFTAVNGGGTQFTAATPVTANITVYAKWTALLDVSSSYALDSTANTNPTGLTITSAKKSQLTDIVTITLGGTVTGGLNLTADGFVKNTFAPAGINHPTTGNWSYATITGILTTPALAANTVIKQTNQSLLLYKGNDTVETNESNTSSWASNPPTGLPNIYISDDNSDFYKLKQYTAPNGARDTTANGFSILLWSGASSKTATFEITPQGQPQYTVIVDWSAVTISGEVLASASGYSLTTNSNGETVESVPNVGAHRNSPSLNISAKRSTLTNAVHITVTGTVATDYQYTAAGGATFSSGTVGANFDTVTWTAGPSDPKPNPAAGKYGAVYLNGLFPSGVESKAIGIKTTSQALRLFTGLSTLSGSALTVPATVNEGAIHIPADTSESPVRWRAYNAGDIPANDWLGLLIWDGATPKTITLEITELNGSGGDALQAKPGGHSERIIIDYSGVTFATE